MSAVAAWAASTSFSVGDVRRATTVQDTGFVFKVTTAGTSGSSEPVWPRKLESTVVDGGVTWTAISSVYQELQKLNPSAIIELFDLKLKEGIHYATGNPDSVTTTQRFHAGTSLNSNGEVVWQGNSYTRLPIEASGFSYQSGQVPRPGLTISNGLSAMTAILQTANETTPGNDLAGAELIRIRTLARYLDAANFSGGSNPLGTPDPYAEFPRETWIVDRKATESREVVSFELSASLDLQGVRGPKRQCLRSEFPGVGTFFA
jgi:lambda family phage minor tail protein L